MKRESTGIAMCGVVALEYARLGEIIQCPDCLHVRNDEDRERWAAKRLAKLESICREWPNSRVRSQEIDEWSRNPIMLRDTELNRAKRAAYDLMRQSIVDGNYVLKETSI